VMDVLAPLGMKRERLGIDYQQPENCIPVPSTGKLQGTYSIDSGGNGRGIMTFPDSSAEHLNSSLILVRVA
jgi:hypothetical protein